MSDEIRSELIAALDDACDWILNEMERCLGRELKAGDLPREWKRAQAVMRKARGETQEEKS